MTGCNMDFSSRPATTAVFQSTAGPMTGCNTPSRPDTMESDLVSIHSRPHDRLQHGRSDRSPVGDAFQSTAGPMTGCNRFEQGVLVFDYGVSIHSRPHDRLQRGDSWGYYSPDVSIHSRPHDRLQLDVLASSVQGLEFQSTAGPMTGCNAGGMALCVTPALFQSTAGPMTGCNYLSQPTISTVPSFNPQPAP